MKVKDLIRLSLGEYKILDTHNIFNYILTVGLNSDGSKYYDLKVNDHITDGHIFMVEISTEIFSYGGSKYKYKSLEAIVRVGGIYIHSTDMNSILSDLQFCPRGSFNEYIKRTTNNSI